MNQFFDEALEESNLTHAAIRVRHVILGFVVIVTLFAMAYVFLEIDRELERSGSVNSDNVTWTLSQVEVDTLKLQRAVIIAADNPADPEALDDLRLAFDIFYSRFNILARSDQIAGLPINSQLREQLWSQNAFFERVTPLIDGPDANLSAALPAPSRCRITSLACRTWFFSRIEKIERPRPIRAPPETEVGPCASADARAATWAAKASSATLSQIIPQSAACRAVIFSANSAAPIARAMPIWRGNQYDPPASGTKPIRVKA